MIAMKHIWKCITRPGKPDGPYATISVAHSADQALIVFNETRQLLQGNPLLSPLVKAYRETPFPHIKFNTGAVMHCRSAHDGGKYIDGHRYDYLSVDEAGWISQLRMLMDGVIIMRLAGGGEIDLVGTPKGYNDLYFYFERGRRGTPGYYSQRGSIYDNPFLRPEDLKVRDALLMSSDPRRRKQVLEGEFVDYSGLAFTRDQQDNAFDISLPDHQDWIEGHRYVTAWDLGRTTDYTVGCTLDVTTVPWTLVDYTRLNKVAWEEIYSTIDRVRLAYHCKYARIDATGPQGDVIEEEMTKRGIPVDPFRTSTKAAKVDLINVLQNAFDEGREVIDVVEERDEAGAVQRIPILEGVKEGKWGMLRLPQHTQLMDELGVYAFDDKDLTQDSVISLALAADLAYETIRLRPPIIGGLYG